MCDLEVDVEAVAAEHGADPAPLIEAASDGLAKFVEDDLATWDGRRIVVSERGRPFVRSWRRCSTPISRKRPTSRATRARSNRG